jgi:pimeloyl-ACP methyl ester carboxylesterase
MIARNTQYFVWNGLRIAFLKAGSADSAKVPLVFLHNGGADSTVWTRQLEHFSKSHQVYAFDFIGYGKSDQPDSPYTLDSQVSQLDAFLQSQRIVRAILIGNCVGASTAIEFASRFPERVDRLVLSNICGGPSFFWPLKLICWSPKLIWAFTWIYCRFIYSPIFLFGNPPEKTDTLLRYMSDAVVRAPRFSKSRYYMTLGSYSFSKFGTALNLPKSFPRSILFWGERNKIMRRRFAPLCQRYLNCEEFFSLPDAGHFCLHEQSEFANATIEKFLRT